jgi:ABC-type antimicrobial peptide transport system permease subunit
MEHITKNQQATPPRWAHRFLQWYCRADMLEEIEGDVYELYYRETKLSKRKANWKFVWNVFRFFRWRNIKSTKKNYSSNSGAMFKSYLITGMRSLLRHRLNGSINILGLSLAIGIAITAFIVIDNLLHTDQFHENIDRIYQVTSKTEVDKRTEEWSDSPMMLGPSMAQDQQGIQAFTRIEFGQVNIRHRDDVFNESIWFVDPDFFAMFSFPILAGDERPLGIKNQLAIEKNIAKKYFGDQDPIGQTLSLKFLENDKQEFTVSAVFELTTGTTLYPTVILSIANFHERRPEKANDWAYQVDGTFIMLRKDQSIDAIADQMKKYVETQNTASPRWLITEYQFRPFKALGLEGYQIINSVSEGSQLEGLISLGVIAGFLLILASLNYMNVAVATVATRLKEIGIRKVVGGQKREIIHQFLTENFLMCSFALLFGYICSYFFLLPGFNSLFPANIEFQFSSNTVMVLFFSGLFLFIGLLSGLYPAYYIASFQPIQILKGREKFGQKNLFSRALLTLQFVFAFITIVGSFVFIDNSIYLKNKDWGYRHDNVIAVRIEGKEKYLTLRDLLSANQYITNLAGSIGHIGRSNPRVTFVHNEQQIEAVDFQVGYNYLETMNIHLIEGRSFEQAIRSDEVESVIINETFAKTMGWTNPIGQLFELDSVKRNVIGVVEDFHYEGFYYELGPVLFRIGPEEDFNFLVLQVQAGHVNEILEQAKLTWQSIAPDDIFEGFIQDEVFAQFNQNNNAHVQLLTFVSGTTVTLACLGLLGLVSFNTTRRMKEYSIRKVMGANTVQIFRLMNKDYVFILLTAFILGAPTGFLLVNSLIQKIYPDPQQANPAPFIIAVSLMALAVCVTVASQLFRLAKQSPSEVLKSE